MKKVRLNVLLPNERNNTGWVRLEVEGKPIVEYRVLGRGSRGSGNTSMLNKGNTPTGTYGGNKFVNTSQWPQESYGPWGAIRLKPISGDAVIAESLGRSGLLIHGGSLGGESYWRGRGALRATHGCLRLSNSDIKSLLHNISEAGLDQKAMMSVQLDIKVIVREM